jgi:uncharacterized membrane protein YhhN
MTTPDSFPWAAATGPALLCAVAALLLVISDFRSWRPGRYLFKPLAALAFLWLAMTLDPLKSDFGILLLVGLLLCAAGDILLMFESEKAFLAGLVSFLCGHLFYAMAFSRLPMNMLGLGLSLVPALILVGGCLYWLRPHLAGLMARAVPAYMLVIAAMLLFASMTAGQAGAALIIAGAWGFACSDLAVARRQFVVASPFNGLWGTPLYFGSQMLLAASLAFH